MTSVVKTKVSGLSEANDSDLSQSSLKLKRKRGSPVSENEYEDDNYAKWKLWLISHYELKQESTTAIRRIVDHFTTEKENFESGNYVIAPDVLGKLVKDIWGEKVTLVRKGSRGHVERHYLHLARKEVGLEKTELPKNWTCISKMDKKTCFVKLENFLLNKQRAATEVIIEELDSGGHVFTIRANGTEQKLSSVLNFDLDNSLKGKDLQHKIVIVLNLLDSCELCKGYKPAEEPKIAASLPYNLCSVRDISTNDTCDEETRAFSIDCLILNKRNGGQRCKNCKKLSHVDRQRKKRKSTRGEMINKFCNRRWLEKEDIEKQLDDCRREKRNATERETYWREKFYSESLDIEDEDHKDLTSIFHGIDTKKVPDEMKCFWEQQQKILSTSSPHGYRWHPKYVKFL